MLSVVNKPSFLLVPEVSTRCGKIVIWSSSTIILKIGELSFYDGNYDNIFKNIELDYYRSELTDYGVTNMVSYQYPKYTLNKRRLIR